MIFPCTSCGLCCKNISTVKELASYDLGNGICKYLDLITNTCKIYDTRPVICQIDKMFDLEYNKYFTKKEFYIENAKVCNLLQKKYNLNNSFRVKIGD